MSLNDTIKDFMAAVHVKLNKIESKIDALDKVQNKCIVCSKYIPEEYIGTFTKCPSCAMSSGRIKTVVSCFNDEHIGQSGYTYGPKIETTIKTKTKPCGCAIKQNYIGEMLSGGSEQFCEKCGKQ